MNTKNSLKVVLLSLFLLSAGSSFSYDPDESDTEAGSPCTTQNCPQKTPLSSNLGERDLIEFSTDTGNLLCRKMRRKPECKGVKRKFIKGCPRSNHVTGCGMGIMAGVHDYLISTYKLTKELLVDKENSTIKSYFHAEFENASQDAGTIKASLETVRPVLNLYLDALGDVKSCLNTPGLTNLICRYVGALGPMGLTVTLLQASTTFGPLVLVITGTGYIGYQVGSEIAKAMTDDEDLEIAGGVGGAAFGVGLLFSPWATPFRDQLLKIGGFLMAPVTLIGSATTILTGSDKRVRERIKQRMKDRIKELEANKP